MAILILNSFRGKDIPYHDWLSCLNEDLYLLCSDVENIEEKQDRYTYIKSFAEYESNEDVIKVAKDIIKSKSITKIIAKSECDLVRAAKLRDQFHIEGQRYEQALAFRDKSIMKSILDNKGIPVPTFKKIHNKNDVVSFVSSFNYPIVLKPIDGAGSLNTYVINNEKQLISMPESLFANNMEVERFITGDMYHIDGLIVDSSIKFISTSKYINSCLDYQLNKSLKGHVLEYHNPMRERLIDFVVKTLVTLPTSATTTFHAEVFHTPNDEIIFCEIASRTGGGRIRESINASFDIDLDELWIKAQCGIPIDINKEKQIPQKLSGWLLIPPKRGVIKKFAEGELPDWVELYQKNGRLNKEYNNPQKSSDCIASFIVSGDSEDQIKSRLNKIEDWFMNNTIWEDISVNLMHN